jgi:hypothetical protein
MGGTLSNPLSGHSSFTAPTPNMPQVDILGNPIGYSAPSLNSNGSIEQTGYTDQNGQRRNLDINYADAGTSVSQTDNQGRVVQTGNYVPDGSHSVTLEIWAIPRAGLLLPRVTTRVIH